MRGRDRAAQQRGIAALEMLLVLPLLLLVLAGLLYFGRYFSYYTAAQKAAHDAARYLATVSQREMKTPSGSGAQVPVIQIAQAIGLQELAGLNPGPIPITIAIECKPYVCSGLVIPAKVRVQILMQVTDQLFAPLSYVFLGEGGQLLTADVTMLYVGQ